MENVMKKLIALCACLLLSAFLLIGCGGNEGASDQLQESEQQAADNGQSPTANEGQSTDDAGQQGADNTGSQSPSSTPEKPYKKITAEEAKQMMEAEQTFIVLDVRSEQEYKERRIDGAVLIPVDELDERAVSELPDKDALILVYCRSGVRSAMAAEKLGEMGFTRIYDIGGIIDWPFETTSG